MISKDSFKSHMVHLVKNLMNIHDPDKFHNEMRFRGIPKVIINIHDGIVDGHDTVNKQGISVNIDGRYLLVDLDFGAHPRVNITEDHVHALLGNGEKFIESFTELYWPHFK